MKTIALYLALLLTAFSFTLNAQKPGDYKTMPTKSSHGRKELEDEKKKERKDERKRKKIQRQGSQRFIMGRHHLNKQRKDDLHKKSKIRKKNRKAEKETISNINTKSVYHRVKKHHRRKNKEKGIDTN